MADLRGIRGPRPVGGVAPPRVLVVEDDRRNLELVEYLLEEAGMEVRVAGDVAAARAELERARPDLVLLDMGLRGIAGLEWVGELRRDPRFRGLPVVALTAHALRGDRERFLAGGCDGYIPKPIDVSSFAAEVESMLRDLAGSAG